MSEVQAHKEAQVIIEDVVIRRVKFIGEPRRENIELLKQQGHDRKDGQWIRYKTRQFTTSESKLVELLKA